MSIKQGFKASGARTLGFIRRELWGVLRQPRLMVTLIVAPFAILLLFGLGYRTTPPAFDTVLVLPSEEAQLAAEQEFLGDAFGQAINLVETTTDATAARNMLRVGDVDLLIIAPANAIESLQDGERSRFVVVHSEVDPVTRRSIELLAELSVGDLNRLVLTEIAGQAQTESEAIDEPLALLSQESGTLTRAVEAGDTAAAAEARESLLAVIDDLQAQSAAAAGVYAGVAQALGTEREDAFDELRSVIEATEGADAEEAAADLDTQIGEFESAVSQLQATDPALLVSPFAVEVEDIGELPGTPALAYAPGTIVVLIQHIAITFAALSLVRERQLGLVELFRISPLKPLEILIGKFVAFFLTTVAIAAALTGIMLALGVPLAGDPWQYTLLMSLVIVASLGLGFALSALATSDSQAVQYTMMVLLASIFFTGLVLPIQQLIPPVRVFSYLLPGTYGIAGLGDVVFRGLPPSPLIVAGLGLYCVIVVGISYWVMRRHVHKST